MKFRVFVGKQKDGTYTAECSSIHDCSVEGKNHGELFKNMNSSIKYHLSKNRRNIEPTYSKKILNNKK